MTNEELMALDIVDRCWTFNRLQSISGWTISRRADYLVQHLDVNAHTADCQTWRYYYAHGDRSLGNELGRHDRYGAPEGEQRVSKHTRIAFDQPATE
jgi:hypothetical protein